MSDDTPVITTAPQAAPAPPDLSGAAAAIYAQLSPLGEGTTATELALAAKVGHSTAGKVLNTLEKLGLAARTPGGFNGRHRNPDLWHHTPALQDPSPEVCSQTPGSSEPSISATAPDQPDESGDSPQVTEQQDTDRSEGNTAHAEDDSRREDTDPDTSIGPAGSASETTVEEQEPASSATVPHRMSGRLARGALRAMVIEHLQAHPSEAFTATKISRVIEKSSGAIANALVTLAEQGIAERVSERPLSYRLTATATAAE